MIWRKANYSVIARSVATKQSQSWGRCSCCTCSM